MSQIEKIVKTYKTLTQIPAVVGGRILSNKTITSTWSQRNIERSKNSKFLVSHLVDSTLKVLSSSIPIDISTELTSSYSPSEKLRAVLRDVENKDGKKQFLEIWKHHNLTRAVDLKGLDLHGDVYTDDLASFEWSPDEKKLLYIAEKKQKKSEPFYKRKAPKADGDNEIIYGQEYSYRQDWGEQMVGKIESVVVLYDIESDSIKILEGVPENIFPAQTVWSPDGSHIVGVAMKTNPRKLGCIYCANRPSSLFKLDFNGNYVEMALKNKCTKSPRYTPDGKTLIWLQRDVGGPHMSNMELCRSLDFKQVDIVVPIVETHMEINDGKLFYGLYNISYPRRCWTKHGKLVLSTPQKNTVNSYIIDLSSGSITELPYSNGSQIVLDVFDDSALVSRRSFLYQDKVAVLRILENTKEFNDKVIVDSSITKGLENCTFSYMDLKQDSSDEVNEFNAIYVGPKAGAEHQVPLIVWPHGGPHSVFSNNLSLEASLFLSMGYAVLLVNYRGSIGSGKKNVDYLLGKVGSSDVADCVLATKQALNQYPWLDPNRLILVGGSHGGFLVTHLSGQYPDMYKAVIARNPVIDIASMSVVSDIPDWCYVEVGVEYTQIGKPDEKVLLAMRRASPIEHAHKVKAPTLLQIGSKDLRVPPSQAMEYYHRLKANGTIVRMNLYEDNHPLGAVPHEMDNLLNTILWIEEYVNNKK